MIQGDVLLMALRDWPAFAAVTMGTMGQCGRSTNVDIRSTIMGCAFGGTLIQHCALLEYARRATLRNMHAIDLRSKAWNPRTVEFAILPAKYKIQVYLTSAEPRGSNTRRRRRVATYCITALTPAGVRYVPQALRKLIESLDCAQLVPAESGDEVKEKGKAA